MIAAVVIDMMEDADGTRIGSDFFDGVIDDAESPFGSLRFAREPDLSEAFEFVLEGGGFEPSFFSGARFDAKPDPSRFVI